MLSTHVFLRTLVLGLALALLTPESALAQNQSGGSGSMQGTLKAFVLTSTYGVIAGGLTGLASLAFYSGEASRHTRNIAIGASLGLYTGILLGAYIVYGPGLMAPDSGAPAEEKEEANPEDPINLGANAAPRFSPTLSYLPGQGAQLGLLYKFN